ncbi:MAG: cupredoxin domain-containing protein [Sphingomonadales bacterium]|nr:cupredoxin domain-containing protein [Sphingomonadales bacterium]
MRNRLILLAIFSSTLAISTPAPAGEMPIFTIRIKDHRFHPEEVQIPANTKVKLIVKNEDATPEEFESHDFNREKIIPGGKQTVVFVGPLKVGTYKFFGEFNPDTAQGRLIAK